jgi:hypothetical protein
MRGTRIGTDGCSNVDEIHIKNASIDASSQQWGAASSPGSACNCRTTVSQIKIDAGHFALSSTSSEYLGTGSAMTNLHSAVSCSSIAAIYIKRGSFHVPFDERGKEIIRVI